MKKRILLSFLLIFTASTFSFAQITATSTIRINLNVDNMVNPDCWLNQGVVNNGKVYMHSGLCTQSQTFCDNQISPSGSMAWEHIVGNWGMDDGVGLMTNNGSNQWSIQFVVYDYYSTNISSGSSPMQPGATPYMLGVVFRNDDGSFEGKDVQCNDIFIKDLQSTPAAISSSDLSTNTSVTVDILTGLEDAEAVGEALIYPNPANGEVYLEYFLGKTMENISVSVFNAMGQEVAELYSGPQPAGTHRMKWDGLNAAGAPAADGMYFISIFSGDTRLISRKLILN